MFHLIPRLIESALPIVAGGVTIASASRWFGHGSALVRRYVSQARNLFDDVLRRGTAFLNRADARAWRERNAQFEQDLVQVRDRRLRRRCRLLLDVVRDACAFMTSKARSTGWQLIRLAERGFQLCALVDRRVAVLNCLTFKIE